MTDAVVNAPKKTRKAPELHPDSVAMPKLDPIEARLDAPFTHEPIITDAPDVNKNQDYFQQLAFMEEPVTIYAHLGGDDHAPLFIQATVNGKNVEIFDEKVGWFEIKYLPTGMDVIVKRKYLELWLRNKTINVVTVPDKTNGEEPLNRLLRNPKPTQLVSIVHDANPRGREWAKQIMSLVI